MKRLILCVLFFVTTSAFVATSASAQDIDRRFSYPKIEVGIAVGPRSEIQVDGNDKAGSIKLWTHWMCCLQGGLMRVALFTFGTPWVGNPKMVLTPGNAETAALYGEHAVFVEQRSATTRYVEIGVRPGGLSPNTAYVWNYAVEETR